MAVSLLICLPLGAQRVDGVSMEDISIQRKGDSVEVSARMDLSALRMKSCEAVILTPFITDGNHSVHLRNVGVYGRSRYILQKRTDDLGISGPQERVLRYEKTRDAFSYRDAVPYSEWMDGAALVLRRHDFGCGTQYNGKQEQVLSEMPSFAAPTLSPEPVYALSIENTPRIASTGGKAYIDYPINKTEIIESFGDNTAELSRIRESLDSVLSNPDATIQSIILRGYASPDGSMARNTRLAKGRTEALRDYLLRTYSLPEGLILTEEGAEDWDGFRAMVASSDLRNKKEILSIADSSMDPDIKEYTMKKKYPSQYRRIKNEIFPHLRHCDYTINYSIRSLDSPSDIKAAVEKDPLSVSMGEYSTLLRSLRSGGREFREICEKATSAHPESWEARLNAAVCHLGENDLDGAEALLEGLPDKAEVTYARAILSAGRDDFESALSLSRKAEGMGIRQAGDFASQIEKVLSWENGR